MNALLDKTYEPWRAFERSGCAMKGMRDCLPYAETVLRVAFRMTGDREKATALFRSVISAYLAQDSGQPDAPPVKFRLLTLLRQQYLKSLREIAQPGS